MSVFVSYQKDETIENGTHLDNLLNTVHNKDIWQEETERDRDRRWIKKDWNCYLSVCTESSNWHWHTLTHTQATHPHIGIFTWCPGTRLILMHFVKLKILYIIIWWLKIIRLIAENRINFSNVMQVLFMCDFHSLLWNIIWSFC